MLINANGHDYRLKLTTQAIMDCEDALGRNPVLVFLDFAKQRIPKMREVLHILHYSLGNTDMTDTIAFYDSWIADGHSFFDVMTEILVPLGQECGLLAKETDPN